MTVIGLTGQTGAGKSTVSALLGTKYGFAVIDADSVAREIVLPGSPALKELSAAFGEKILLPDGSLDRAALAADAFSSPEKNRLLKSITHPAITALIAEKLGQYESDGTKACVIDAALLLQSDAKSLCDFVAVVTAPEKVRFERIVARDGLSREKAAERINAQPDESEYLAEADVVVRNYPPFSVEEETDKIFEKFLSLQSGSQ